MRIQFGRAPAGAPGGPDSPLLGSRLSRRTASRPIGRPCTAAFFVRQRAASLTVGTR